MYGYDISNTVGKNIIDQNFVLSIMHVVTSAKIWYRGDSYRAHSDKKKLYNEVCVCPTQGQAVQ